METPTVCVATQVIREYDSGRKVHPKQLVTEMTRADQDVSRPASQQGVFSRCNAAGISSAVTTMLVCFRLSKNVPGKSPRFWLNKNMKIDRLSIRVPSPRLAWLTIYRRPPTVKKIMRRSDPKVTSLDDMPLIKKMI
jgi:hypothetical protein